MSTKEALTLQAYSGGVITALGVAKVQLTVDEVITPIEVVIVPDGVQMESMLVGQTFKERPHLVVEKDHVSLKFRYDNTSDPMIRLIEVLQIVDLSNVQVGEVDEAEKTQLLTLIHEYRNCFACFIDELGCVKGVEMKIVLTGEAPPFCCRPYHMAPAKQKQVREILEELQFFELRVCFTCFVGQKEKW